jgi:transcriptional regulator with XRE-family HTH domain
MAHTYAQAVRHFRLEKGLSQAALARAAGLHPSLISAIERGKTDNPTFETLIALADGLGITKSELVGGWEPPSRFQDAVSARSAP